MQQPSSPHEEDWVVVSEEHRDQDELLDACYAEIRAIKVEEVDWEKTSLIDYYIQQVRLPFIQKFGCAVFTLPVIEHSPVANPLIDYDRRLFKVYEEHVVRGFMDRLFEAAVSKQFAKMFASLGPHLDKQQIEDHVHLIVCTEEMQAYRKICEKKVLILFYVSQILQFTDLDARRGTGETRETSSVCRLRCRTTRPSRCPLWDWARSRSSAERRTRRSATRPSRCSSISSAVSWLRCVRSSPPTPCSPSGPWPPSSSSTTSGPRPKHSTRSS